MIETTITKIQYDADGVQRRWSIPFPYADAKHISIYTKVGEEPAIKIVDNYDIDEDDSVVIYPTVASGQEPVAAGTKIIIARETPETQLEDASQVHFTSKDVERGLDKLTMITQELSTTAGETMEVSADAFEAAEEAVSTANEANVTAGEAKTLAEQAVSVANDANATATAANTKSDTAIKTANDASEKSTAAVSTANSAKTVAGEANSTANKANATATQAKEIATAANTTANNADKIANEADKKADNAVIVANNAKDIADGIDAKATQALDNSNTAINTANSAKQTAEGIDGKATQALANSNTALETATEAKNTADSYQGPITTLRNDIDDLGDQVAAIEGKIPADATTANQLADKEFVTTITDELAADITALNADIQQINLIKWVQALPATGESKYIYAVPREETDTDGKQIAALYLWDGSAWRGAGAFSLNIDPATLATKTDLAGYLPLASKAVANGVASLDANAKVPYEQIPTATTSTLGGVKPDGTTITVTEDGVISAVGGGGSGSGFDFEGTKAEFDAAVAAGTITEDSVSLITDDVSGDNVATKADLVVVENSANNLTNLSDTGKTKLKSSLTNYALRFPDYNAVINLDSTVNIKKQYIAPNDGWISYTLFERTDTTNIVASVDTPGKGAVVWVNGNRISEVANWSGYVHYTTSYLFHPVKKGDVIDYYIQAQGYLYFYPMLGAN